MRRPDSSKKPSKGRIVEIALFGAAFLATLSTALSFTLRPKTAATMASVLLKGTLVHRLSLQEEKELSLPTDIGEIHIHVHDGGIGVSSSPCASQYCVHQGLKKNAGDTILCVPAGLAIYLDGGEKWEVSI